MHITNSIIIFIITLLCVAGVAYIIKFFTEGKYKEIEMSFREAMDLVDLPLVTFYNGNKKLNFLLDTGSDNCHINSSLLPELSFKEVDETMGIIGVGGTIESASCCEMTIIYKDKEFINKFFISNLDGPFNQVKAETGVQIHGILGSKFFKKYKYILDFETLTVYAK